MLVVDASALVEVLTDAPDAERVRALLAMDDDQVAPHLIDAETLSVIERLHRTGSLDQTQAYQAVTDLRGWPGQRWSHVPFLDRAWDLRANVRGYDALYVALAEAFDAPLLTLDRRLAEAPGIRCDVLLPD